MTNNWKDLIIIPQGPSERVDKIRLETAWLNRSKNTKFIIAGSDEARLRRMENHFPIYSLGLADTKKVIHFKDTRNYAEIFKKSIPYIKDIINFSVSVNYIGGKRFNLYLESAIEEGLLSPEKKLYCLKTNEWKLNPGGILLEKISYNKDKKIFRNQKFTLGLEEKLLKSPKKLFGIDIKKISW